MKCLAFIGRVNEFVGARPDPLLPLYALTTSLTSFVGLLYDEITYGIFCWSETRSDVDLVVFGGGSGMCFVFFGSLVFTFINF